MAIFERKYQGVSNEQVHKCIRFCQNELNLRDWCIGITIKDVVVDGETCFGASWVKDDGWTMQGEIEIDLNEHKKEDVSPYRTVCHEMIHILTIGKCHINPNKNLAEEFVARTFEDMLYQQYCKFAKIKIMPMKRG